MSNYKLLCEIKINDEIPVRKYLFEETGLLVYLAQVSSPVTNSYKALATEEDSDDGLPHTLEHLVFLGSEDYPYKGVLDLLANRSLASGTNAWTETDNTVYTLGCAGSEGFLRLLPVYLDHILFPTLTESGFMTEIYSVTKDGEDNGAVYCEMQGRENSGESRGHLELLRNIYPDHGYSKETGGIMKNIRESLSIEKIRRYHKKFYRAENFAIIICGQVNIEEVAASIAPIEQKVKDRKSTYPPYIKPWQVLPKPLKESKDLKILFPSDEEENGLVYIGFMGPKATSEFDELTACYILMKYLSDTSVSPLCQTFIEISEPFASEIRYNISENSISLLYFTFENVPIGKIDFVYEKLIQLLVDIANGKEELDEHRLDIIFEKYILERLSSLENSPHDDIAFHILGDFLYGNNADDFNKRLNVTEVIHKLQTQPISYWTDLLRKYFVDNRSITIRAVPSVDEKQRLAKDEAERIENRKLELGEDGLQQKGTELDAALAENDRAPPLEMLRSLPVPTTKSITFHQLEVTKNYQKVVDFPFYTEIYDLKSNFIYVTASFDTSGVPKDLRSYLLIFLHLILESPIQSPDGTLIPYETVVAMLEEEMISYETNLGLTSAGRFGCGTFSHMATFQMQIEVRKLAVAVDWMTKLIFDSVFNAERIHIVGSKLLNDVATAKRNGFGLAREISKAIYYRPDSNVQQNSVLKQYAFLSDLIEVLKTPAGGECVVKNLNMLRDSLVPTMSLHVATNFAKVKDLAAPFKPLTEKFTRKQEIKEFTVSHDWSLMNMNGNLKDGKTGTIVGIGCIESGFLFHTSPGIKSFMDPDVPGILLYLQYLSQLEGPMWKKIRKNSYGYNVVPRPNEALIAFSLYRATNMYDAFKDAKMIVEAQTEDGAEFDVTLLESAKSSLIFEIIEKEKTVGHLEQHAISCSFNGVPKDYNKHLVEQVASLKVEELKKIGQKYLKKMFDAKNAKIAIVCHPDKVEGIKKQFEEFGHDLQEAANLEASILNMCS